MTTRRQRYIDELVAALKQAGLPGAIEPTLAGAFADDEGSVLVVHRGRELPTANVGGSAVRDCQIRVSTVTRGRHPEEESDKLLEVAHPIVMQFKSEGLLAVSEQGTDEPKYAEDGNVCLITAHYTLKYKTGPATLGQ